MPVTSPMQILSPSLQSPNVYVREREQVYTYQPEVEVPVINYQYRKVIKHEPIIQECPVVQNVEVHHRTIRETPEFTHVTVMEELVREVPRTIIREQLVVEEKVKHEQEFQDVEVAIPVSPQRYEVNMPKPEQLTPRIVEVPVSSPDVNLQEEVVEVPCVIEVPQLNFVETTEMQEIRVPVEVTHRRIVEKAVEVAQERILEKVVEVPRTITERITFQKPVLVSMSSADLCRDGFREAEIVDEEFYKELDRLRAEIHRMETEREQLSADLTNRVNYINGVQQELLDETRKTATLQLQVDTIDKIASSATACISAASPAQRATSETYGQPQPLSATIVLSPGIGAASSTTVGAGERIVVAGHSTPTISQGASPGGSIRYVNSSGQQIFSSAEAL